MSRQKRNVINRIERDAAQSLMRREDFKALAKLAREYNSTPGEWETEIIEHPSPILSKEEQEIIDDIVNNTSGVFFKPRNTKEYKVDASGLKKYQILGFSSYTEFCGWLQVNRLNNLTRDFDSKWDEE